MSTFTIDALGTRLAVRVIEERQGQVAIGHVIDKGDEVTLRVVEDDVVCFRLNAGYTVSLGPDGGSVLLIDQADVLARRVEVSA